jgi:hypothetical protein
MIAFGTVAGGAGAALTGGNFWQGAVTGLVVSGLNHAMHQMGSEDENSASKRSLTKEERQRVGDNYPTKDKGYTNAESVYKEIGGDLYKKYLENPEKYVNTCAIRLSVAFEKAGIDIGGDYNGTKGLKYYTSATRIYRAIDSRFISFNKGFDMSQYGIAIQFADKNYTGQVFHVDVVYIQNNQGRFGNKLYGEHYNKFY